MLKRKNSPFTMEAERVFLIDSGSTKLTVIQWRTDAPPSDLLPMQQTLERLVCDALLKAHPDREKILAPWFDSLTQKSRDEVKTYVWSNMAGWYGVHSCDDFYRHLWDDQNIKVREELIKRLEACGAWSVARELTK